MLPFQRRENQEPAYNYLHPGQYQTQNRALNKCASFNQAYRPPRSNIGWEQNSAA